MAASSRAAVGSNVVVSLFISVMWLLVFLQETSPAHAVENPNPVLLVVFDGFGWDFMRKASTPNLDGLIQTGATVPFVWNVFPASSLPNHYTLATGLYPSSHGIISNGIYDSKLNANFTMRTNDSVWFENAEPIWITNQKQGFKSGNCFWPGYNVNISGYYPSFSTRNSAYEPPVDPLNVSNVMPWHDRVDLVVTWLTSSDPPSFVVVYFEEPDEVSHKFGPDSNQTKQQIHANDELIGYLLTRLKEHKLDDKINLIITADHGQIGYNTSTFINMDEYVPPDLYDFWPKGHSSIIPMISPKKGKDFKDVVDKFRKAAVEIGGKMQVFERNEIPENLHFKYKNRVGELLIIMEAPWKFNTSKFIYHGTMLPNATRGTHGYNTSCKEMRPFFIAHGPAFKQGHHGQPIHSVDLYPLICHLLGIQPAPNNGSLDHVKQLLRESIKQPRQTLSLGRIIVGGVLSAIIVVCLGVVVLFKWRKWRSKKTESSGLELETESFTPLMSNLNYDSS